MAKVADGASVTTKITNAVFRRGKRQDERIRNAKEYIAAVSAAIDAIDPTLDVYEPILELIAAFVPYRMSHGASPSSHRLTTARNTAPCDNSVGSFEAGSVETFNITNDGKTATKRVGNTSCYFVCVAPSVEYGTYVRRPSPASNRPSLPCSYCPTGSYDCSFRVDSIGPVGGNWVTLGIVSVSSHS